jgi:thiol-disulfide isomerase/thioredoxin
MRAALGLAAVILLFGFAAPAQTSKSSTANAPQDSAAEHDTGAEAALEKAFAVSGNDRAALVRNLQQYLLEFPNAPRKPDIYRALVESCRRLQDDVCALNYAERLVAIQPDDSDMMLVAVNYLQRKGDDESLTRASGYITRVIDRVEKQLPGERPPGENLAAWQTRQENLRGVLYYLRGQIRYSRQDYEGASKDLAISYSIRPSAGAAEMLGGIAELEGETREAINEYTLAFVLPDPGPDAKFDRREIRERLGNVWRAAHGNEQGLGDAILAAYDRVASAPETASSSLNKNAKNVFAFTLRRLDGTPMSLSTLRGKIVVLNFWATWCVPCTQVGPAFNELAMDWAGEKQVAFFAVNTDEDETGVSSFLQQHKWNVPVIYADGLDRFLNVKTLPAMVVLGPEGQVLYHVEHPALRGFAAALSGAVQQALGPTR